MRLLKFLTEGGNAVKDVVPINAKNVKATLQSIAKKLLPKLNLSYNEIKILGSAGKKNTSSGDIDIALPIDLIIKRNNLLTINDLLIFVDNIISQLYYDKKIMKGMNMISVAWPIENIDKLQADQKVQVDLMFVDNVNWAAFVAHSPYDYESKWKGIYRTGLLMCVAKFADQKILKKQLDNEGNEIPVIWERYILDKASGLQRVVQSILGKSGQITKAKKALDRTVITQDPQIAVEILFGKNFKIEDMNSFESIYNAIHRNNFLYKNELYNILKEAAKFIHNNGYPLPNELAKYI